MLNKVRSQEYVFNWMLQNVESDKEIFFGEEEYMVVNAGNC